MARLNAKFNRTKDVRIAYIDDRHAAFELHYKPGFTVTKDVCNWNLGIYAGLAKASGARAIAAQEVKCVLDGDAHCEIRMEWRVPGVWKRLTASMLRFITRDLVVDTHDGKLEVKSEMGKGTRFLIHLPLN